jgi:tetratricopeptide (TPR) repeat protein
MATRYRAFISYAHSDERWAKWLQTSLEQYRAPKKLGLQESVDEAGSDRLFPIFRDRDELASSSDLSQSIQDALEKSDALLVVCSPDAAKSKWVNEEIRYFQGLGRGSDIFCLLIEGSPDPTAAESAFPPALLQASNGEALPEPLAADVRPNGDGKRGAMLKIAASLLKVGIDDLKQRDAQRQLKRHSLVAAGSMAIATVTLALAVVAIFAREDAEVRRVQAEGLISFMLGDLRGRLEPLGRLDLLDAVGDEALDYFAVLGERGTEDEVLARVMALRQIGEVRFRQAQFDRAQDSFEESRDLAEYLSASSPRNEGYLFELGQAEFWVGYAALEQGGLEQAAQSMDKYMRYSQRLLVADPENADYQLELVYAYSNVGSVALRRNDADAALDAFRKSVVINEQLAAESPDDVWLQLDLGNGLSWIGAAQLQRRDLARSEAAYRRAVDVLARIDEKSDSPLFTETRIQNTYHLGNVLLHQGKTDDAEALFAEAVALSDALVDHDPENGIWRVIRAISSLHSGEVLVLNERFEDARNALTAARNDLVLLLENEPNNTRSAEYLAMTERLLGELDESPELLEQAHARMTDLLATIESPDVRTVLFAGATALSYGHSLNTQGQEDAARRTWSSARGLLDDDESSSLGNLAILQQLLLLLGETERAFEVEQELTESGFRDPRFRGD